MINILPYVNSIFCLIIALNGSVFYIILEKHGRLYNKLSYFERNIIRLSLIFLMSGSLYSALKCETRLIGEILLNLSLSIIFTWGAIFHNNLNRDNTPQVDEQVKKKVVEIDEDGVIDEYFPHRNCQHVWGDQDGDGDEECLVCGLIKPIEE